MSKGQRGNKEAKKPKKAIPAPSPQLPAATTPPAGGAGGSRAPGKN